MRTDEYARYDAVGLMGLVRARQVSPIELRRCALEAIERMNPRLNFMAGGIGQDEEWQTDGAFSGLPFLLKEGHGWLGGALTMGSRLVSGLKVTQESEITGRLRAAGVQIIGETTASEFGIYPVTQSRRHGVSRNPWNLDHSPGGSSGGSAAAVAAGVVPVAQASDGGGSIRGPAHCTGIFGLKPSRGRTPSIQRGLFAFTHVHVLSRTVRDSAAFLDAIQGPFAGSQYSLAPPARPYLEEVGRDPGRLRIGVLRHSPGHTRLSRACAEAIERAARLAEALGHVVEDAQPEIAWGEWLSHFLAAWIHPLPFIVAQLCAISSRNIGPDTLDEMTLRFLDRAKAITVDDLLAAESAFQRARVAVDSFFGRYDIWMTPCGVSQAPEIGQFDPCTSDRDAAEYAERVLHDYAIFTPLLNITGHPAASVPLHQGDNGLPAAIQVVGSMGREDIVLRLCAQLEAQDPWIDRHPACSAYTVHG
jgi:amidase